MMGPLLIVCAALLWSADGLLRQSLYSLPAAVIVFWEHVLGVGILYMLFFSRIGPDLRQMKKKEWIAITLVALFSGALGTIFYTMALGRVQYIQFSVVALLQQLQPIWAIGAAHLLLKERVSRGFLFWAGLAIVSSYLITFRDLSINMSWNNPTLIAALLALGAGFVWAVSTSFSKIVLEKVSFQTATFLRFALAPVFALLFVFIMNQQSMLFAMTPPQWQTLAIIMFSTGMVALLIYYFALRRTPAKVSAICELAWPASAIFIDYFYISKGKNPFSATQILGIVILFISLYYVSKYRK